MIKIRDLFPTLAIVLLLTVAACGSVDAVESDLTPDNAYLEEELAAEAISTTSAKKTQTPSTDLPYVEISNGKQTYLAFWFTWNDETVFLPIAESSLADSGLLSCQLGSKTDLAIGELFSGWEFFQDDCVVDEKASENALPVIRILGYFDDGIKLDHSDELDAGDWNIIDLNGEYAESFTDVATFIVENDLLGSGDLTISIYRTDGPNGDPYGDESVIPTYSLLAETLQISFSTDQLGTFEYVDDVLYALEREFTWKIPAGFRDLNLSPGDDNWFFLKIREMKAGNNQEEEYLVEAYIQIKGVGASATPDN